MAARIASREAAGAFGGGLRRRGRGLQHIFLHMGLKERVMIGFLRLAVVSTIGLSLVVPAAADTVEVLATGGLTFEPTDVTIQSGDSVHFTGLAGGFHTVAEVDDGAATSWNGGFHSPGGASEFTQVFNSPGVFHYICEPHVFSGMRGTVTVNELPVPTVSTWGLALLVLLMLVAGTIVIRRVKMAT